MKKKIYNFIKENYRSLVVYILLYIILMWPLNYYIIIGGGISSLEDRVEVTEQYKSKGSLNLSYVSEVKGVLFTYVLSYIMPNWKRVDLDEYTYASSETIEDINFRGKIDLENANSSAIYSAFKEAGEYIKIKSTKFYVVYSDNKNSFKVGDQLLEVDGIKIKSLEQYKDYINTKKKNDIIKVKVNRDKKTLEFDVTLYLEEDRLVSGIMVEKVTKYKTKKEISLKFKKSESGPSGGLMTSLQIYNKLTKKDITKGRKIAGTGTIDSNGRVGEIGGVKYKILGAAKKKADIFLVPSGANYKTAVKVKKKNKLKIKIIKVSSLKDAIEKLNK